MVEKIMREFGLMKWLDQGCRKEASAQQTMNLWVPCLVRRPVPSSKQKREKAQSSISVSTEGKRKGHSLFPSGRASKRLHHVKLQASDWLQGTLEEEQ
ncbi:hypothetical protein Tco_0726268 [Tanacetum coccineum]|uniref:Uncharacterized protein n=1 Tax=Tanacetum coccineum TaxID=301880 RepID=A0ABQ4YHG1_9ASTR